MKWYSEHFILGYVSCFYLHQLKSFASEGIDCSTLFQDNQIRIQQGCSPQLDAFLWRLVLQNSMQAPVCSSHVNNSFLASFTEKINFDYKKSIIITPLQPSGNRYTHPYSNIQHLDVCYSCIDHSWMLMCHSYAFSRTDPQPWRIPAQLDTL